MAALILRTESLSVKSLCGCNYKGNNSNSMPRNVRKKSTERIKYRLSSVNFYRAYWTRPSRMILSSPHYSTELDPLTPFIIERSIDIILPSFTIGLRAIPLFAKESFRLSRSAPSSLRSSSSRSFTRLFLQTIWPISNVTFISKIIEILLPPNVYIPGGHGRRLREDGLPSKHI